MLISVVIPTCNRASTLGAAIDSIVQTNYPEYEIIIVDQSTSDDTRQFVLDRYKDNSRIQYIHSEVKCSSDSRNIGWRRASGEYIAFTDDDAYVDKHWLHAYAREIAGGNGVGMIGGRIVPVFEKPRPMWLPEEKDYFLPSFDAGEETAPFPENSLPISVNLLASKKLLVAIGGFDTRLGLKSGADIPFVPGGEDSFLGIQARNAGFTITYLPTAVVYHPITAERLSPIFFLRRSFREGVTTIAVDEIRSPHSRESLEGHIKWHARNVVFLLMKIVRTALFEKSRTAKTLMLTASELAFSCGVVQYSRYLNKKFQK